MRNPIIHNIPAFRRAISEIQCGEPFFTLSADDVHELPFETKDIGVELPDEFPNCCEFHKGIIEDSTEWFEEFPECCEDHKKLLKQNWFNKAIYQGIELSIAKKVRYTEAIIEMNSEKDDWYKTITDFIEYICVSFGHPSIGQSLYLNYIEHFIESTTAKTFKFEKEKREKLIEYINTPIQSSRNDDNGSLNELAKIYKSWLNSLPKFTFLNQLKEKLSKRLPILKDEEYNPFLETYKYKKKTKSELINHLYNDTKSILLHITGDKLIEKGIIKDFQSHQYQLILEHHKHTQNLNLKKYENSERKYVEVLNKWLYNEKKLFQSLDNLKVKPPKPRKNDPTLQELFRGGKEKYDLFIKLLKSNKVEALNEKNEWIYEGPKSSIVACFIALEELGIIKKIQAKAKLQRIVRTEIQFDATEKLFRNSCNSTDSLYFNELFSKELLAK